MGYDKCPGLRAYTGRETVPTQGIDESELPSLPALTVVPDPTRNVCYKLGGVSVIAILVALAERMSVGWGDDYLLRVL